ncbi:RluA family pseudouridine synthase [Microbulbifer sp. TRSA007]|uniref:RluA family pseudouridine synthase n=1 Tax=Microbulbifer sp. TRSA007 TaxID=3243384 RepID=UPI004039F4B1
MMRKYTPPNKPFLSVVYEDEMLLILDKPSGLLTVPGRSSDRKDSLFVRSQNKYPGSLIVHRLDMDTSGLVVMARSPEAHKRMSALFQYRKIEKTYYARVWGVPEKSNGEVDLPLICDWPNRPRQKVDFEVGKASLTHWKKISSVGGSSLLRLKPITGRSHQLRVHMNAIGHPILGDPFYAHQEAMTAASRLLLHASELEFVHPYTESLLTLKSDLPIDFYV